ALGQGGSVSDALKNALFNTLAAASFNLVGDYRFGDCGINRKKCYRRNG
ncbi:Possible hemagglutinin, partial [Pseudomonas sp. NFR09]